MGHLEAIRTYDNGRHESRTFNDYNDLCRWLADEPTAGIAAYNRDTGETLDQQKLQEDVAHFASMEPRPFERGNHAAARRPHTETRMYTITLVIQEDLDDDVQAECLLEVGTVIDVGDENGLGLVGRIVSVRITHEETP